MSDTGLNDAQSERLHELFVAAVDLPAAERAAFCARACAADERLRSELEAMLAALPDDDDAFLAEPALSPSAITDLGDLQNLATDDASIPDPERVGPYRILERLGEGGMGVVYLAEQTEPVRRRLALKVIKPGMDTERVIARFAAERQALAMMDHPGIASIYDAGTTVEGRPWFAMELVAGKSLHDYCRERQLPTRTRLELIARLCDAVQHAHQKGIIHRDLKPSNVLVVERDGEPHPVIIDFGIARAMVEPLTDHSQITRQHEMVGTFDYMSPEQADRKIYDVDSRADIYSLGVMLFELLTGELPFDRATPVDRRTPHAPSTRVGKSATTVEVASQQATDARALRRTLRGELDWITIKALEPSRDRRYASASELAADVRRYLVREPVLAGPPGVWYRWTTFARRYRLQVTAAAAIGLAVLVGATFAIWGWLEASDQRAEANVQREKADLVVELLAMSNSESGSFAQKRRLLDRAAGEVERAFGSRPRVEAAMRTMLGRGYVAIGENLLACEQLGSALALSERLDGISRMELHEINWLYLWPLQMTGRNHLSEDVFRRSFFTVVDALHPDQAEVALQLAALFREKDANRFSERVDALMATAEDRLDDEDPRWLGIADCLTDFASVNWGTITRLGPDAPASAWRPPAHAIYRNKIGLVPSSARIVQSPMLYVTQLAEAGRFEEALAIIGPILDRLDAVLPRDHDYRAWTIWAHGVSLCGVGDHDRGLPLLEEALAILGRIGDQGYATRHMLASTRRAHAAAGNSAHLPELRQRLIASLQRAYVGSVSQWELEAVLMPEHDAVARRIHEVLERCRAAGGYLPELDQLLEDLRVRFPGHGGLAAMVAGRLILHVQQTWGRCASRAAFVPILEHCIAAAPGSETLRQHAMAILANMHVVIGDPAAALETAERLLAEQRRRKLAPRYEGMARAAMGRAMEQLDRGAHEVAREMRRGYEILVREMGHTNANTRSAHHFLQTFYVRQGWLREGVELAQQRLQELVRQSAPTDVTYDALFWMLCHSGASADEAAATLETATWLSNLRPDAWLQQIGLAMALVRAGKPNEALVPLAEVKRLAKQAGQTSYSLPIFEALALHQLGRRDEAEAALGRARQLLPKGSDLFQLQVAETEAVLAR